MTSQEIFPLAQRLQALIPAGLQRWIGEPTDAIVRAHLADDVLLACDAVIGEVGEETNRHGIVISEALAGFLTMWGSRYGNPRRRD